MFSFTFWDMILIHSVRLVQPLLEVGQWREKEQNNSKWLFKLVITVLTLFL